MRLLDFMKRAPSQTPSAASAPKPAPPKPAAMSETPEGIVDSNWRFKPTGTNPETGSPYYEHSSIVSMCAIHMARSLESIADDLTAIRKHVTRLQLVPDAPSSASEEEKEPTHVA